MNKTNGIGISHAFGNFLDGKLCGKKQVFRLLQAASYKEISNGLSRMLFEFSFQMRGAEVKSFGNFSHRHIVTDDQLVDFMNKRAYFLYGSHTKFQNIGEKAM